MDSLSSIASPVFEQCSISPILSQENFVEKQQMCCNQLVCEHSPSKAAALSSHKLFNSAGLSMSPLTSSSQAQVEPQVHSPTGRPGILKPKRKLFDNAAYNRELDFDEMMTNAPKKPDIRRVLEKGKIIRYRQMEELPCILCDKVYVSKKFLQRHKILKHGLCKLALQFQCNHCASIFSDRASFEQHCLDTDKYIRDTLKNPVEVFKKARKIHRQQQQQLKQQQQQQQQEEEDKIFNLQQQQEEEQEDQGHYKCPQCDFVGTLDVMTAHLFDCTK